jgi:hypothetical protein
MASSSGVGQKMSVEKESERLSSVPWVAAPVRGESSSSVRMWACRPWGHYRLWQAWAWARLLVVGRRFVLAAGGSTGEGGSPRTGQSSRRACVTRSFLHLTTCASCSSSSDWCSSPRLGCRLWWWGSPEYRMGEPLIRCGLEVRKGCPAEARRSPVWSSPGPGRAGSFRVMAALDLLLSRREKAGEPESEGRRESCWMPALMLAAAASETEEERGDGDGVCRWTAVEMVGL